MKYEEHECDEYLKLNKNHNPNYGSYAIDSIFYDEKNKEWIGSNGEYSVVVAYCPFCGKKLGE